MTTKERASARLHRYALRLLRDSTLDGGDVAEILIAEGAALSAAFAGRPFTAEVLRATADHLER